jgi:hypothetical protein
MKFKNFDIYIIYTKYITIRMKNFMNRYIFFNDVSYNRKVFEIIMSVICFCILIIFGIFSVIKTDISSNEATSNMYLCIIINIILYVINLIVCLVVLFKVIFYDLERLSDRMRKIIDVFFNICFSISIVIIIVTIFWGSLIVYDHDNVNKSTLSCFLFFYVLDIMLFLIILWKIATEDSDGENELLPRYMTQP